MDRKTNEFENSQWKVGAQGLYAEYGNRVTVGEKNLDGLLILLIFLKSGSNLGSSVMLAS